MNKKNEQKSTTMKISKNFTLSEFNVSASYPELAKGIPINIRPAVIALVTHVLQPICDKTGWTCKINSGYRSIELNRAVGGVSVPPSQHMKGEAADCVFMKDGKPVPIIDVLKVGKELFFDQMIAYPSFVHFSHSKINRRMVLYNSGYKGKRL